MDPLKISLSLSLLGIFILLFLAQRDAPLKSITEIQDGQLNQRVHIRGLVKNQAIYQQDKPFSVLTVHDSTGSIQVTCSCDQNFTGKIIQATGKVSEYNTNIQINADIIALIEDG